MIHRIVFKSQEVNVQPGGGLPPNSGPRLKHPNIPLPWNRGGPSSSLSDVVVVRVPGSAKPEKGFRALHALTEIDCPKRVAGLFGPYVALLAMKYGRAPLRVPHTLWKASLRSGLAHDAIRLGHLARRYVFLGDARKLLAESRKRPAPISYSLAFMKQSGEESLRHSGTGDRGQCP